ncbi:MAG: hypothetical protein F6K21_02330 [Symploca sp. SIO2D2]|nr:hypothetical protein [Symploca sp. SIO2D2]
MSKIFFYTDPEMLSPQSTIQAFGSVKDKEKTDYRLTSMHTATIDTSAIAVCDGLVFVQAIPDSELVNIILKPLNQEGLESWEIGYFIYRGIKKNSLVSGNEIAAQTTNDLTENIWKTQESLNSILETDNPPSFRILGLHLMPNAVGDDRLQGNDNLSSVFFKKSIHQLPKVRKGWTIGEYTANHVGFEVLLLNMGFEPKVSIARVLENTISVQEVPANATSSQKLANQFKRSQILNYLDPCAFYGLFFKKGIRIRQGNAKHRLKADELFDNVLSKYYTAQRCYIDIRNEFGYPLNAFQNYSEPLHIATGASSAIAKDYHNGHNWPILTLTDADFSDTDHKTISISIKLPAKNNISPMIYLAQGFFEGKYPRNREKLKEIGKEGDYTSEIILETPTLQTGKIVPNYIHLAYLRKELTPDGVNDGMNLRTENYSDNLFDLAWLLDEQNNLKIPLSADQPTRWHTAPDEVYVPPTEDYPLGYIAKVIVAEDSESIYLLTYPNGESLRKGGIDLSIGSGTSLSQNFLDDILLPELGSFNIYREDIELSQDNSASTLKTSPLFFHFRPTQLYRRANALCLFAFDKANDWPAMQQACSQFLSNYAKRLVTRNIQELTDLKGRNYLEGDICVNGHKDENGIISIVTITTTIKYYKYV